LPDEKFRSKIARKLFDIFNPFWFKNDLLLENIKLSGDLQIKETLADLKAIAGDKWFFHKELARMAAEVLNKWK
jgi:hypothetical protein